ncbi:competence/damage-inducible protein A [bacterium]|nr:competence/damage-inducible protein A [bacterium]
MSVDAPDVGLILIGDELLSGRRRDKHLAHMIEAVGSRGREIAWVRIIGDSQAEVAATLRQTRQLPHIIFSFGGIGGTPDDRTRQAAAEAFETGLEHHPTALKIIEARYRELLTPRRLEMINFPVGSALIINPVNQVPGFTMERHHFVPGFPELAWPMVEWVFEQVYKLPTVTERRVTLTLATVGAPESDLSDLMQRVGDAHSDVRVSSLPKLGHPYRIEFGFQGAPAAARAAMADFKTGLSAQGVSLDSEVAEPAE